MHFQAAVLESSVFRAKSMHFMPNPAQQESGCYNVDTN